MQVVILDTVTLRHFIVLGRVPVLREWLGGDLLIPQRVHQELLTGVTRHDPRTLSQDPAVAAQRSARFQAYPEAHEQWGIRVLPSPELSALSADGVQLLIALDAPGRPPVHAGEKEVIVWAYEQGYRVCTDDRGAYQTLRALIDGAWQNVPVRPLSVVGTPGLLAEQIQQGRLSDAEAAALWSEVQEVWRWAPKGSLEELLQGDHW
jgi:predicted nucleic acid-binding protein